MNGIITSAIIAAAGSGSRMKSEIPKQFMPLCGIPILVRTLLKFESCPDIDEIIIVTRKSDIKTVENIVSEYKIGKVYSITEGGSTRQESVQNGLNAAHGKYVLIHDGARPFVTPEQISSVIDELHSCDAAALGIPVTDTLKLVNSEESIIGTQSRDGLYCIQTPQGFKTDVIKQAHKTAAADGLSVTDDCALCENIGIEVRVVHGSSSNIKITTPEDMEHGMGILNYTEQTERKKMRVGMGYDVHKLTENRPLILGGVNIPYNLGLLGHSDADVLLHAIMDALLGAASLGDIGKHFPDTDPEWLGADSQKLLTRVGELLKERGAEIVNIDSTIIAQQPKLAEYISDMIKNISSTLQISENAVSVKATTTEKLGFCGRGEGIAAEAVCCIMI